MKKRFLLASVMSIALCLALIAGATFALFTSEQKYTVKVESGELAIAAVVEELELYSPTKVAEDGTLTDATNAASATEFVNGGTAAIVDSVLEISKMTPGDKVTFKVVVSNTSNVAALYRAVVSPVADEGLLAGLVVTVGAEQFTGLAVRSNWAPLAAGATPEALEVSIELPGNTGNEFQKKSTSLEIKVEAVQSNADVKDAAENEVIISDANQLFAFASAVNNGGNNFAGKVVKLDADIDLQNKPWTPIGQTGATEFKGVFDGQNHTISNLYIDNQNESANCSTGLFGWIESHGNEGVTVKNVKVSGATVKGHHYVGVIVGYVYGTIENCVVTGAEVSCTSVNDDANGDKCGGIAGYVGEDASIINCNVTLSAIDAGRDAGAVVGAAKPACVTGCTQSNNTVTANGTANGNNIRVEVIGREL